MLLPRGEAERVERLGLAHAAFPELELRGLVEREDEGPAAAALALTRDVDEQPRLARARTRLDERVAVAAPHELANCLRLVRRRRRAFEPPQRFSVLHYNHAYLAGLVRIAAAASRDILLLAYRTAAALTHARVFGRKNPGLQQAVACEVARLPTFITIAALGYYPARKRLAAPPRHELPQRERRLLRRRDGAALLLIVLRHRDRLSRYVLLFGPRLRRAHERRRRCHGRRGGRTLALG
mmetsp:Transcript_10243/g.30060  ORF Transcript_10243/g.30060 Transcript_10243/m.30060 type:complete len:239 (-) Transcript_10243:171-887(-)